MMKYIRFILLVVSMLFCLEGYSQTTKWQDIYTVKKKDTVFGIAKKYGLTLPELMEANPDMKKEGYTLQKGATLFIPYSFQKSQGTKASQISKSVQGSSKTTQSTPQSVTIKVGVMLPLHDVDGDGRRMVEYYRGFLMACGELKQKGLSIDIHAWNVPIDADVRTTLAAEGADKCDVIVGPLYTKQVTAMANFCKENDIKMLIPFSINGDDVEHNKNIFQVYQSPDVLNDAAIDAFIGRFPNAHPIFVDCNDSTSKKGVFTFGLRKVLEKKKVAYSITNANSSLEYFSKAFDRSKQNVVILNTGRSPQLTSVLNKLDELTKAYPGVVVSLFGYTEWLMYAKYNLDRFFKYDTYIPSTFYYNTSLEKTNELERAYADNFQQKMQAAMPRFAITGYDHAMFFLQGMKKFGRNFAGERTQVGYSAVQTPLNFIKTSNGGYKNKSFLLVHYTFNHQIEAINY